MGKVYIYEQHQGFTIYISDRELDSNEVYCSHCDASDVLLKVTSNIKDLEKYLEVYDTVGPEEDLIKQFHQIVRRDKNESEKDLRSVSKGK